MKELQNAKDWAKTYKGHSVMYEGIATYKDEAVYLSQDTLKKCMPELKGRPVIIEHKLGINPSNMEDNAVGYVTNCEYNNETGDFDCDFVIFDDEAKKLLKNGYTLSTSYIAKSFDNGGTYINTPYDKEITGMDFTHLAIVKNPRYEKVKVYQNSLQDDELFNAEDGHWITVHPNGEEGKGRHLFIKKGETVGDAMHRTWGALPKEGQQKLDFKGADKKAKEEKQAPNKYHSYMEKKITEGWYKDAEIDYGVKGKLLSTDLKDDTLSITWEEQKPDEGKKQYKMDIPYASDHTKEQLYNIWSSLGYEVEDITPKKSNPIEDKMAKYEAKIPKNYKRDNVTKALWLYKNNFIKESEFDAYKKSMSEKQNDSTESGELQNDIIEEKEICMDKIEVDQSIFNSLLEMVTRPFNNSKKEDDTFEYEGAKYSKQELVNCWKKNAKCNEEDAETEDVKDVVDEKEEKPAEKANEVETEEVVVEEAPTEEIKPEEEKENSVEEVDWFEKMQELMNSNHDEDDKIPPAITVESSIEKGKKIYG